jgi:hypothetical protein
LFDWFYSFLSFKKRHVFTPLVRLSLGNHWSVGAGFVGIFVSSWLATAENVEGAPEI